MRTLFSFALVLISAAAFAQTTQPRVIHADLSAPTTQRSTLYKTCVGAGRVGEGLRAEWQRQLKVCRDEIGFEQIRMHGLLHDELGVYAEGPDGTPRYNWQYVDAVYDYLLSIGVRPFVEIGFMPNALASGTKTVFWWKSNVTPPKDYAKWDELVTRLVQHWTDRYGAAEVRKWNFEIWNEPNHVSFFEPTTNASRRTDYFKLYEHTARAVTKVDSTYRVGGPASAGPAYIKELIDYCSTGDIPLDFISFHSYGLKGGPGGFDANGDKFTYLNPNLAAVARISYSQFPAIAKSPKPGLPVHITEWSTSYSARDPVHDSYISAAYILENLRNAERVASMSYWTFTDIFEETGVPTKPFHGGFGLINVQGIKKPAYFAYKFLNELGDRETPTDDARTYVTTNTAGGIGVLFWDATTLEQKDAPNQTFFRGAHPPPATQPVAVALAHCSPGRYRLAVYRVGFEKNDAYSAYQAMGAPADLSLKQTADLKAIAAGEPDSETDVTIDADGQFERTFDVRSNDVFFLKLTKQ